MPIVETNGARLNYEVSGDDTSLPALVFIHAGIAHLRMWDPQVAKFAASRQVVTYDTRGFGKTETDAVRYSNRQDLLDLLNHLGLERVIVIGCSRGGQIAVDFTLEFPHRVAGLVSVCGGVSGFMPENIPAADWEYFNKMEALEEAGKWDELLAMETALWVDGLSRTPDQVEPQFRALAVQLGRDNLPHNIASAERAAQAKAAKPEHTPTEDASVSDDPQMVDAANEITSLLVNAEAIPLDPPAVQRLDKISIPTLVVVGAHDSYAEQQAIDKLVAEIPGAHKYVVQDSAHLPSLEKPEEFNTVLEGFLASI